MTAVRQLLSYQGGSQRPDDPHELQRSGRFAPTPEANWFKVRGQSKVTLTPVAALKGGLLGSVLGPPLFLVLFWLLFKTFHISSFMSSA